MGMGFPFLNNRTYINLIDFLNNPSGKGSAYMTARTKIIQDLENRYFNLLKKHNGKFEFRIYHDVDKYVFIFNIPSETYDNLYYDVVLEFHEDNKDAKEASNIYNHSMRFFSNSPSMMFTYTYVLEKEGLIVDWLKKYRCSKEALKKAPKVRNPVEQFGFEKSCYFAALYIREHKFTMKSQLKNNAIIPDKETMVSLVNAILSQDQKLQEYNELKEAKKEAKEKTKKTVSSKSNKMNNKHKLVNRFKSMFGGSKSKKK